MIIRIALLLLLSAILVLLFADLLLELALPILPEVVTQLGLGLLLCGFLLFVLMGLALFAREITAAIKRYFSATEQNQRQLLFIETKQQYSKQLFFNRALKIRYLTELKRRRLLRSNQQKHINALSKAINQELRKLKSALPKETIKQLQQQNRHYRQTQDSEALLKLQQTISYYER